MDEKSNMKSRNKNRNDGEIAFFAILLRYFSQSYRQSIFNLLIKIFVFSNLFWNFFDADNPMLINNLYSIIYSVITFYVT